MKKEKKRIDFVFDLKFLHSFFSVTEFYIVTLFTLLLLLFVKKKEFFFYFKSSVYKLMIGDTKHTYTVTK